LAGDDGRLDLDERRQCAELALADGVRLSLEAARNEFFHQPGRPPDIKPASIMEDLRRRDFSVNAMGISLSAASRGLLLDPTNGLADLESRQLRVLHNYSFLHDPVRLLRLLRFASRLGFRPEQRTRELFDTALARDYPDTIQPEGLGREVENILREENAVAVLKALAERELLAALHPILQKRKPDYDGLAKLQKYRRQAEEAGYRADPFYSGLHYLCRRLKSAAQKRLLRNLALKKDQIKQALAWDREARKVLKLLGRQRSAGPRQTYHLLGPVPVERLVFILAEFSSRKKLQSKVYNYLFKYRPLRAQLPVRELQLMGVPPGPKSDQILEKYFEAQLDGKLRSRTDQLRFLRKLAGIPKPKPAPPKPKKEKKGKKEAKPAPAAPEKAPAATPEAKPTAAPAPAPISAAKPAPPAAPAEKKKAEKLPAKKTRPKKPGKKSPKKVKKPRRKR